MQGCGAVTFLGGSGSGLDSGELFRLLLRLRVKISAAPSPAPGKMYRLGLRLRLRCLKTKKKILNNNTIYTRSIKCQNMTSFLLDPDLNARNTKPVIVIVARLKLLAKHVSHKHTSRALSYDYIEATFACRCFRYGHFSHSRYGPKNLLKHSCRLTC